MSATTHEPALPADCRNCGMSLAESPRAAFCGHCGQETALHPPTLGEFVHEFVGHYVALEGALWKSLALLLLKPGQLTREYFAGRRRRYVLPLRLYLTASFLFFLVVKLLPASAPPTVEVGARPAVQGTARAASAAKAFPQVGPVDDDGELEDCLQPKAKCSGLMTVIARASQRWKADPQAMEHFWSRFVGVVPYALFLMLPVFSAIVMLAYRGRRMLYGEHVVFALHLHAFWFLALLATWLLPPGFGGWLSLVMMGYGVWALQTVYQGRWRYTLLRALLVGVLYWAVLTLSALGLLGLLFLFG